MSFKKSLPIVFAGKKMLEVWDFHIDCIAWLSVRTACEVLVKQVLCIFSKGTKLLLVIAAIPESYNSSFTIKVVFIPCFGSI